MSSLAQHPVLRHMTPALLRNPNLEDIRAYLVVRRKQLRRILYLGCALFVMNLLAVILGSRMGANYITALLAGVMVVWATIKERQCIIPDEELRRLISEDGVSVGNMQ